MSLDRFYTGRGPLRSIDAAFLTAENTAKGLTIAVNERHEDDRTEDKVGDAQRGDCRAGNSTIANGS